MCISRDTKSLEHCQKFQRSGPTFIQLIFFPQTWRDYFSGNFHYLLSWERWVSSDVLLWSNVILNLSLPLILIIVPSVPSLHACVLSHFSRLYNPMDYRLPGPLSVGFSRQEYWSGLPFPSPGDLPKPGMEPWSPLSQAVSCTAGK